MVGYNLNEHVRKRKVQRGCIAAEKLYSGFFYQKAGTEQRRNPDVLCRG